MIILIKHTGDWELISQIRKTQINKDNIPENGKILDHDYKVEDKEIFNNNTALKYKTP